MRGILFALYLMLFALYISINPLLTISIVPNLLVSYWLLKDDIDLDRIYKEVEKLQQKMKDLEKKRENTESR